MNVIEAMAGRVSTRSFDGKPLTRGERAELETMLATVSGETGPFGHQLRFALHFEKDSGKPVRMGTYGLIAGATAFIVPAVERGAGAMEDTGYLVEKAVLEATAAGWSSCWIGGVFSRSIAGEAVHAGEGEIVPVVIALGRPSGRRTFVDRVVTNVARARSRKPLDSLAFTEDGAPLPEPWREVAEAARGAPSASNKQPWRFLRLSGGPEWLVFLDEDRVYNNSLGEVHLQNLDVGIAMRHFFESARSFGLEGSWTPSPVFDEAAGSNSSAKSAGAERRARLDRALRFGRERGWAAIALWA